MTGKFITLEGMDGAGKSTHLAWLAELLRGRGLRVTMTREPGGTPLGEELRKVLLHRDMHPETETLLMFAARREHLDKVILPALRDGAWVVSDRFSDASYAYQGGGRGLAQEKIAALEQWAGDVQPDLTLLFDLPPEVARSRLSGNAAPDRFEQEREDFFRRVREVYLARAQEFPQRIRVIDTSRSPDEVKRELEKIILPYCP